MTVLDNERSTAVAAPTAATRYCLTCDYALDGLPEHRCPECGREFDPDDGKSFGRSPRRVARRRRLRMAASIVMSPVGVIAAVWGTLVFPPLMLFAVPLVLAALVGAVYQAKLRRAVATVASCLVPLGYYFSLGIVDYGRGTATLQTMGLPGTEFHNVDAIYRCYWSTGGCVVRGFEMERMACRNAGVKLMVRLFGPMAGSYLGPIPTRDEALDALKAAEPILFDNLESDEVHLATGVVILDSGVGSRLTMPIRWIESRLADDPNSLLEEPGPITGVMYRGSLLLRVPIEIKSDDAQVPAMIVAIDPARGRPFAYYGEGGYTQAYPPVRWQP